jgi:hypothetical protein
MLENFLDFQKDFTFISFLIVFRTDQRYFWKNFEISINRSSKRKRKGKSPEIKNDPHTIFNSINAKTIKFIPKLFIINSFVSKYFYSIKNSLNETVEELWGEF